MHARQPPAPNIIMRKADEKQRIRRTPVRFFVPRNLTTTIVEEAWVRWLVVPGLSSADQLGGSGCGFITPRERQQAVVWERSAARTSTRSFSCVATHAHPRYCVLNSGSHQNWCLRGRNAGPSC